jgi:hypothetical protein
VGWTERGVVTASSVFLRSVGSSLGIAVFGAIANATVGTGEVDPARLTVAVHRIVIGLVVVAAVILVMSALIPRSADQAIKSEAPAEAAG